MSSLTLCFTVTVAVSGYEKVVTDRHAYIQAQLGPRSHQHLPCLHHHAPHAKTFGSTVKSALWTPQKTGHLWCCGHFILSRMLLLYKIYSIIWTLFYHFRKIVCHIRWICIIIASHLFSTSYGNRTAWVHIRSPWNIDTFILGAHNSGPNSVHFSRHHCNV